MEDILELTRQLGRVPNVGQALHIMQWELGDLAKAWTYSKWHPDLSRAYEQEAKKALADLIFQARVVAALLDIHLTEVIEMGEDAVRERIKDKERKVDRFKHYVGDREGD